MTARKRGPIAPDYHVSVSQFKTFWSCPRMYWYKYPMGVPDPGSASTKLGSQMHAVAEKYLSMPDWRFDWEEDKAHRVFSPGREYLPAPGTGVVELKLDVPIGGLKLVGAIDWLDWLPDTNHVHVLDHKSSKDPDAYGLGKEVKAYRNFSIGRLQDDLQMNVYLEAIQRQLGSRANSATLQHVTYRTQGLPYAVSTVVPANLEYAKKTWAKLEYTVPKIVALRKEADSAKVPTIPASCGSFGGCPYQGICDGSPKFKQYKQLSKLLTTGVQTPAAVAAKLRGTDVSTQDEMR